MNRPCKLYYIPVEETDDPNAQQAVCLTNDLTTAFCPSLSPDEKTLIFFSSEHAAEQGIHDSGDRLYALDWTKVRRHCFLGFQEQNIPSLGWCRSRLP